MRPHFPWAAVIGQQPSRLALLLCAIDPGIGGVLVRGPRGVAKTTLARGFSELLSGRFVELPLGATEERVVGTLDLSLALGQGQVQFSPGLLALAHDGVLYVDEVNLLPDALVDLLLDAAASGVNVVERDGVSHVHPARFVLVGTMNPDEGELRPQLLDRFGLCVSAEPLASAQQRAEVVLRRLEFERDPERFVAGYAAEQRAASERCQRARERAAGLEFASPAVARAAELCQAAGIEGLRADLAMLRAARAHAAWHERDTITPSDVDAVAELALAHRRRPGGPERPGPGGGTRSGGSPPTGSGTHGNAGARPTAPTGSASSGTASSGTASATSSAHAADAAERGAAGPDDTRESGASDSTRRASGALAPVPVRAAELPTLPAWLVRPRAPRLPVSGARHATVPRQRRARGGVVHPTGPIDWASTLARTPRPTLADLRRRPRRLAGAGSTVFALDCSASMLQSGALRHAKALICAFAAHAARARTPLALVSFGGADARLELSAPRADAAIDAAVRALAAGGGTPLRRALELSLQLCRAASPAPSPPRLFVLTDGRTRDRVDDLCAHRHDVHVTIIDCERGPLRLGRARRLAASLEAALSHIDALGQLEPSIHA